MTVRSVDMRCRICGWWPPMVRERRRGDDVRVVPASQSWRWRALRQHIYELAEAEYYRGPHEDLVMEIER
jgi:hypothetical protein